MFVRIINAIFLFSICQVIFHYTWDNLILPFVLQNLKAQNSFNTSRLVNFSEFINGSCMVDV